MWHVLLEWIGYLYLLMMILFLVGFFKTTPPEFQTFTTVLKVLMAIFLLVRFNPYGKEKRLTELDRNIILYTAYFILLSSFTDYVNDVMVKLQTFVTETTGDIFTRMLVSG